MPGSVQNAAPTTTLPQTIASAFQRSHEWSALLNEYADGESQRKALTATARRAWKLTKRLPAADLTALRAFFIARGGPTEPFYFFDPYETSPKFTLTPSGTQGRYTVRFAGNFSQSVDRARGEVAIELVEVA
jgi:phage-related protein